jgi:outer membrane receptor protein involved in Fe transport
MRFSQISGSILILALAASAAEIKVRVVDPQSAAVSGAQITLWRPGVLARQNAGAPLAIENTSAEGLAVFHNMVQGSYRAQVLAPGFAAQTIDITSSTEPITVRLKLAPAAETVVVTATRNPVPGEVSGSQVESLSGQELETTQPVAANDTLRFLPGAVVNTAGQRGGLASLFVRGGDSTYNKVIVDGVTINAGPAAHRGGSHGIFARRAEHALRIGCHDERSPGLDSKRQHADS